MDSPSWLAFVKPFTDQVASATGLTRSTVVAALILVLGLVLASILGRLAKRLIAKSAHFIGTLQPGGLSMPHFERVERAVGGAVYWLVIVCAVMAATETLGLPVWS